MATLPDVEVLDDEFLVEQRRRLEAQREETARTLARLSAEINGLRRRHEAVGAEEGFGRVDTASVDLDRARSEQVKAAARLAQIDGALERLDSGTYGRCEECARPIGRARLEAIPEATRCIVCQARPPRHPRGTR